VVGFYMFTIYVMTKIDPKLAPSLPSTTWREKAISARLTWPIILLFLLVMGGIYSGIFTATEAGAIGAFGALIISLVKRQMTGKGFWDSLMDSAKMTAMIIIILIGAYIFNAFLAITQIPFTLSEWVVALPVSRWIVYIILIIFYLIAGCFFDIYAIIILTVPVIYPTIKALGFDLIWYSVIMVRIMEIGMITPPFGINLFGIVGVIDAPLNKIYRGVIPFIMSDLVTLVVLSVFPVVATYLPYHMFSGG
jgi:C4-dicarboxylate transporter DctM subunit